MQTKIVEINEQNLKLAVDLLLDGELIGMPTETVYGLAGVGTNPNAVKNIFKVKGRPSDNPLIAHVHKDYDISKICIVEQDYVKKLIDAFLPGPLTMVFKSNGVVCSEALAGGDTVAIRVPSHEGCQKLLKAIDMPLVAPSANLSKHVSPVTSQHVFDDLNGKIPLILEGGKCFGGIESTVLDVTCSTPRILRLGLVTQEMIKQVVGACDIAEHKESDKVKSPGVKYHHYMPNCETALFDFEDFDKALELYDDYLANGKTPYILCDGVLADKLNGRNLLNLGYDEKEIASNLYMRLRDGEEKADIIIAVLENKNTGIYDGIFNRLTKACKKVK